MNSNNKILGAPVIINLDGSFLLPTATGDYVAGQLSPDLRMGHLDSFLEQLSAEVIGEQNVKNLGAMLASTTKEMVAKLKEAHTEVNCTLTVRCTIDPVTHQMEYVFDVSAKAK